MGAAAAAAAAGAAAAIALLKGGRGQCRHCGQHENNVSYHEEHECPKRVREAPDWLVERMDKLSKMSPATIEEVKIQLAASGRVSERLNERVC